MGSNWQPWDSTHGGDIRNPQPSSGVHKSKKHHESKKKKKKKKQTKDGSNTFSNIAVKKMNGWVWMFFCFFSRFVFCVSVCVSNITSVWTDVKIKHWLIDWLIWVQYLFKATVEVFDFGVDVVPAGHGQHLHDLGDLHQVVARDVADGDVRRDAVGLRVADGRADEQRKHQVSARRSHLQQQKEATVKETEAEVVRYRHVSRSSGLANPGRFPQGKLAATESCYPTLTN